LASTVTKRLNDLHSEEQPGCALEHVAAFIPMDGYHLSRAQLSALPDPDNAHARRGAEFTFDGDSFLELVKIIREPLTPEAHTLHAPSFDHAIKDPVKDDIPIPPTSRVLIFEGNYLSLDKEPWKQVAELMDELWFVEVDFDVARDRLVKRHVVTGVASSQEEALKRAKENDLVNGKEIVQDRIGHIDEEVVSLDDDSWKPHNL
jgi:pantothenate kinase